MTQMEIYSLALEAMARRYDLAQSMVRAKPCDETKAYRDHVVEKTMELRRMVLAEHKRRMAEAEEAAEEHRYETIIEYDYGHVTRTDYPNKEVATKAYNILKDLMGTIPVITRVSMTDNGATIRSCEREQ